MVRDGRSSDNNAAFPGKLANLAVFGQNEAGSNEWCKSFTTEMQLKIMIYSHLAGTSSLRELENGFELFRGELNHLGFKDAPSRSTIAYANEHRNYKVFEDIFNAFVGHARKFCQSSQFGKPKLKFKFKGPLYAIDSTTIDLCHSLFDWADFRRTKGGVNYT